MPGGTFLFWDGTVLLRSLPLNHPSMILLTIIGFAVVTYIGFVAYTIQHIRHLDY